MSQLKLGCFKRQTRGHVAETDSDATNDTRAKWGSQVEFWLSVLGWIVGPGNLWRFPYLCMRNGGGAFLIPYVFFLVVCAMPLMFLEISIAQYSSKGFLAIWDICPLFRGVGYATNCFLAVAAVYWILVLTWVIYYFASSFAAVLPWSRCDAWWNTPNCTDTAGMNRTSSYLGTEWKHIALHKAFSNGSLVNVTNQYIMKNSTPVHNITVRALSSTSVEEFWRYNVLQISSGIGDLGNIRWQIMLCHMAAWSIILLCVIKGIRSSGKVVYVTATLPYILLSVLLVRGAMLEGSLEGIKYYLTPEFQRLMEPKVWGEACVQIFYSFGICWGSLMTMGSYNNFHYNCCRDSIILTSCSALTSFFAGFVIFSVMGHLAVELNMPVSEVIKPGPGLAFIAYPEALAKLPGAPFWAALFFLMFFTACIDGQFPMVEAIITSITDVYPQLGKRRSLVSMITCLVCFLLGLPLVTQGGVYIFQLFDWHVAVFTILITGLAECFVLAWVYGIDRLFDNLEEMLGSRPSIWWKICWRFLTPASVAAVLVFNITMLSPVTYGDYTYPLWARTIGYLIASVPMLPIPVFMVYQMIQTKGTIRQRIHKLLQPSDNWGSAKSRKQQNFIPMLEQTVCLDTKEPKGGFLQDSTPCIMSSTCAESKSQTLLDV